MSKSKKPEPPPEPEAESSGAASMAGKVIVLHCRGCSRLVPTEHAWNKPADGMAATCPTCATVTTWRKYELVDGPPEPEVEPEPADATDGPPTDAPADTPAPDAPPAA